MTTLTDENLPESSKSIQEPGQQSEVKLHSKGQPSEAKDQESKYSNESAVVNCDDISTKGGKPSSKDVIDPSVTATFQSSAVIVLANADKRTVIESTKDNPEASIVNQSDKVDSGEKMLRSQSNEVKQLGDHDGVTAIDKQSGTGDIETVNSKNSTEEAKNNMDESKNRTEVTGSPVVMRRKSSSSSEMNMEPFQGLLRGSTIGSTFGAPPTRKVVSKIYEDVLRRRTAAARPPVPPPKVTSDLTIMEKEDDIDVAKVMASINCDLDKRVSLGNLPADHASFDEAENWDEVQQIFQSIFAPMDRGSKWVDIEPAFTKFLAGSNQMESVGEWLEKIGHGQYENMFRVHGFDNVDFMDSAIMEEQDLEEIGVLIHDHRREILDAAKSLPRTEPIDWKKPPESIEEWLMSLNLLEILETFKTHGYDTMDKVGSILWDLQLRTVLDISVLGHRKRILASLGERTTERQNGTLKKSISSLSHEEVKSPFGGVNLFHDYSDIKPTSSSEEDVTKSPQTQMSVDSDDEEVFNKKPGQSIRDKQIHIRPPHLAQTKSPARNWRHRPEMLIKGCCNYTAQYLGSTAVENLSGTDSTRAGISKLKKSSDALAKIPQIMLSISYKGVKFIDARSKRVICDHEIGNIFCACQDTDNLNFFAYITRDIETATHFCHVFSVKSSSLAHDIILTLGESFEVAYQMALKDKANEEAMNLDRQMSQSDAEVDTHSVASKTSTNTV